MFSRNALVPLVWMVISGLSAQETGEQDPMGSELGGNTAKISPIILAHRDLKVETKGMTELARFRLLRDAELDPNDVAHERCALYVEERLASADVENFAAREIFVSLWSWVPPVPGHHPYGFYLARVGYNSLDTLEQDPQIVRVESTEWSLRRLNDIGRELVGAEAVHNGVDGRGLTGAGVKVAVADSGLDLTHEDIPEPIEAFDTTTGTGPGEWSRIVTDRISGHGTHVTGTAVGRGTLSDGRYRGAAPGADLYFYKIEANDGSASSDDAIEALNRAVEVGCDIFTMSYGGWSWFLDGSEPLCQTVDAAVERGMTCFFGAGNEAADNQLVTFPMEREEHTLVYTVDNTDSARSWQRNMWFSFTWRGGPAPSNLTLAAMGLAAGESLTSEGAYRSPRGTANLRYRLRFNVPAGTTKRYELRVSQRVSCPIARVHCWAFAYDWDRKRSAGEFDEPDPRFTVLDPALSDRAIAVGAFAHRTVWKNARGEEHDVTELFPGAPLDTGVRADFSSLGPRMDGLRKPQFLAPGQRTISCRDSVATDIEDWADLRSGVEDIVVIDNDGENLDGSGPADYLAVAGTSMASPLAAGCAALLLEAYPELTPAQVKFVLQKTGSQADNPDNNDGYGLIDIRAAIDYAAGGVPEFCDVPNASLDDCDANGVVDSCEIASGAAPDCDGNGRLDQCDIAAGRLEDCNSNGVPDTCELVRRFELGKPSTLAVGDSPEAVVAADIDGDGRQDLATANSRSDDISVLLNAGSGTFHEAVSAPAAEDPRAIAAADLDGTGLPWLLVLDSRADSLSSYRWSRESGELVSMGAHPVGDNPQQLAIADMDADGDPDVVTLNRNSRDLSVLTNTGGELAEAHHFPVEARPAVLDVGDVNGDGRPDAVVTTTSPTSVRVLPNDGAGGFGAPVEIVPGATTTNLRFAFVDDDEWLDIVTADQTCSVIRVYRNLGDGSFEETTSVSVSSVGSLVVADLDGSGYVDVVSLNRSDAAGSLILDLGTSSERSVAISLGRGTDTLLAVDADANGTVDLVKVDGAGDSIDIFPGGVTPPARDCNENGILDDCDPDGNGNGIADACERGDLFLRGDCNADGAVNISDATCILNWLFAGEADPGCVAATNTNGDDAANITDATYLLNHLFAGGPAPVAPYPDCGAGMLQADPVLGCATPPACQ